MIAAGVSSTSAWDFNGVYQMNLAAAPFVRYRIKDGRGKKHIDLLAPSAALFIREQSHIKHI